MSIGVKLYVLHGTCELCRPNVIAKQRFALDGYMPLVVQLATPEMHWRIKDALEGAEARPTIPLQPIIEGFSLYLSDDLSSAARTADLYGNALRFTYAKSFRCLHFTADEMKWLRRYGRDILSTLAYLRRQPPNTPVVIGLI